MKILYISESQIPSRTANSLHVMKICAAFAQLGHDVTLISRHDSRNVIAGIADIYSFYNVDQYFSVHFIPSGSESKSFTDKLLKLYLKHLYSYTKKPVYCWKIRKHLNAINPDFVIARSLVGCAISIESGFQTFFEKHQPLKKEIDRENLNRLSNSSKFIRFIAITDALKQEYSSVLKSQEKLAVLPDGADIANSNYFETALPDNDNLNIGYVGSLYKGKGIEVIEQISKNLPLDTFHIVGGSAKDIAFWKERIKTNNVKFHGYIQQHELKRYYKDFDICILPNQEEVFGHRVSGKGDNIGKYTSPLKLFEYMSYKKPIIASDLPVLREILNENNAVLVTHDKPLKWVKAINKLRLKKVRDKIANQAHEEFIDNYTWAKRAEKIINLYDQNKK